MVDFVALDVETANPDLASVCQIGFAEYRDGRLVRSWGFLIDPEDYFDEMNVSIHGIDDSAVRGHPLWRDVYDKIVESVQQRVIVSHTAFDRTSLHRVCQKYGLKPIEGSWLDSSRVVRRAWSQYARSGYGLSSVAKDLNIPFRHHDAREDARVAGEILVRAVEYSGKPLADWLVNINRPIGADGSTNEKRDGNPDGPLFGEVIVFTGALSMTRQEAATLAATAGCEVATTVKKNTTLLVVGDQDIRRLAGHEKSAKHRKAEELIAEGRLIRILGETDFRELISISGNCS
jgi:DNA polymerase-3 subunit epsilon